MAIGTENDVRLGASGWAMGRKYLCRVCSYVYDPVKGDVDNGINPGTSFEDLPKGWVCPECGVGKEEFDEIK